MASPALSTHQQRNREQNFDGEEPDYAGILSLLKLARSQTTHADLGFVIVNQTHNVVPYFQAFLWDIEHRDSPRVVAASGVSDIDHHAPVVRFMAAFVKRMRKSDAATIMSSIDADTLSESLREEWLEWFPRYAVWCPFITDARDVRQGVIATNDIPFTPAQIESLSAVVEGYAHCWRTVGKRGNRASLFSWRALRKSYWLLTGAFLLAICMFIPVRFSVLAGARVVPTNPIIVAAPIDGVIDQVLVRPNQTVRSKQLLFEFNDTQARTSYELAESDYRIAIADYELSVQKSFTDIASKAESETLALRVEEKRLAVDFARVRLAQTSVYAEKDGIALFVNADHWKGRPVSTGERIMTIANPNSVELIVELDPGDGGAVVDGAEIDFFVDTDPNNPIKSTVRQIAYETELSETGELFFPISATFAADADVPRLGLKGTAKVYGDDVSLFYFLFRKPWSIVRQSLNF